MIGVAWLICLCALIRAVCTATSWINDRPGSRLETWMPEPKQPVRMPLVITNDMTRSKAQAAWANPAVSTRQGIQISLPLAFVNVL